MARRRAQQWLRGWLNRNSWLRRHPVSMLAKMASSAGYGPSPQVCARGWRLRVAGRRSARATAVDGYIPERPVLGGFAHRDGYADRRGVGTSARRHAPAGSGPGAWLSSPGPSCSCAAPREHQWGVGQIALPTNHSRHTNDIVGLYANYQHERCRTGTDDSDMVFVNQFRPPLGRPMTYSNTTDQFDRLSRQLGLAVRPHMLRHTAANSWRRQGGAPRRHARSVRPCVVVVDGALFPSHRF